MGEQLHAHLTGQGFHQAGYPQHQEADFSGCPGPLIPAELAKADTGFPVVCAKCGKGLRPSAAIREQCDRVAERSGFNLAEARKNKRLVLTAQAAPARKAAQLGMFGAQHDTHGAAAAAPRRGKAAPPGQGSLF